MQMIFWTHPHTARQIKRYFIGAITEESPVLQIGRPKRDAAIVAIGDVVITFAVGQQPLLGKDNSPFPLPSTPKFLICGLN